MSDGGPGCAIGQRRGDMNCDPALSVMGPIFAIVGAFVFYLGIMAWARPQSSIVQSTLVDRYAPAAEADPLSRFFGFTRERAGSVNLNVFRFLGPLNGGVFFVVGVWVTVHQILCGFHFPNVGGLVGSVEFKPWAPSIFFVLVATAIGFWNSFRMGPVWCTIFVLLASAFGFAGSQSAAFHTGVQGERWFAIAILIAVSNTLLFVIHGRLSRAERAAGAERADPDSP